MVQTKGHKRVLKELGKEEKYRRKEEQEAAIYIHSHQYQAKGTRWAAQASWTGVK